MKVTIIKRRNYIMDFSLKSKIREKLYMKNLKDKHLAEHLELTKDQMSNRLNGRVEFSHSEIENTLEFLECEYNEIFRGK